MLEPNPVAVLTPWRLAGKALPTQADILRILEKTESAYLTNSPFRTVRAQKRDRAIERSIREANIRLRRISPRWGGVRLRRAVNNEMEWSVTCFGEARNLAEFAA